MGYTLQTNWVFRSIQIILSPIWYIIICIFLLCCIFWDYRRRDCFMRSFFGLKMVILFLLKCYKYTEMCTKHKFHVQWIVASGNPGNCPWFKKQNIASTPGDPSGLISIIYLSLCSKGDSCRTFWCCDYFACYPVTFKLNHMACGLWSLASVTCHVCEIHSHCGCLSCLFITPLHHWWWTYGLFAMFGCYRWIL